MTIKINSNVAALNAQRQLSEGSRKLEASFQRLSSGLRINRASDDASGLAISQLLNVDARVFTQGVRNMNDGLSVLSIAEGALEEATSIIIRVRELATQSANGTFTFSQRKALNQEANALVEEYNRIVNSTGFNGRKILDGSLNNLKIQGAYGSDGGISVGIGDELAEARGTGELGDPTMSVTFVSFSFGLSWGDMNNDGNIDQFVMDQAGLTYNVFLGNGDGTFRAMATVGLAFALSSFGDAVDLNGDGNTDVVGYDVGNHRNVIFISNGDGTFRAPQSYDSAPGLSEVSIVDVNNDGAFDIINTSSTLAQASVRLGNGDGSFLAPTQFSTTQQLASIKFDDINRDGKLDFLGLDKGAQTYHVAFGTGDGNFSATISRDLGYAGEVAALKDLDGDGYHDLVAASFDSAETRVYLGNGDGSFREAGSYNFTGGNYTVGFIDDINGDGIFDISFTSDSFDTVLALGNGDGTFRAPVSLSSGGFALPAFDTNNDGVRDILSVDFSGNYVIQLQTTFQVTELARINLYTRKDALESMEILDDALMRVSAERGAIGSAQSRISTALSNLQQSAENFRTASSRITDADVAEESSGLVKNQILQQAAAAVLGQANLLPSLALRLLEI